MPRKGTKRVQRSTWGFSPVASTDVVAVSHKLTASEFYWWVPLRSSETDAVCRPSSLVVRAAADTPTNLRFAASLSDDGSTWRQIWSSNTGLVGTNSQLIKLKIPKIAGRANFARIGAVSSGTPTLCGSATFVFYDPE